MTKIGLRLRAMQSPVPCNSLGRAYAAVEQAIDDLEADGGGGWVYVPPGTWNEALTMDDNDLELFGAGWASIIDGGTTGHAINISAANCIVKDLQTKTTAGGGNSFEGITCSGNLLQVINVFFNGSDNTNITFTGNDILVAYCYLYDADFSAANVDGPRSRWIGNYIHQAGWDGLMVSGSADNCVIRGNIINTVSNNGIDINANGEDCIYDGNRITGAAGAAINDASGTSTAGDNDTT